MYQWRGDLTAQFLPGRIFFTTNNHIANFIPQSTHIRIRSFHFQVVILKYHDETLSAREQTIVYVLK